MCRHYAADDRFIPNADNVRSCLRFLIRGSFLFPSDNSQSLTAVDHLVDQLVAAILPVNGPGNGLVRGKGKLGSLEMDAGAGPHRILSEQSLEAIGDIGQTDRLFDQIYLEQSVIQLYVLVEAA